MEEIARHPQQTLAFLLDRPNWLANHSFCFRSQGSSHWARLDIRDCLGSFRRVDVISIHAFLLPPVRALLARESFWQVVGPWHVLVLLHKCPHCGLELS
jgi:hypothetical protein